MYKLTITQGCPASGKTTFAKTLNAARCNRDDIRRDYFPSDKYPFYKFSKENENKVTEIQKEFIRKMGKKCDIVVDDTNLNPKSVEMFRRLADEVDMSFEIKRFFDCGIGELLKRNIQREHSVPEDVIVRMYKQQMEMQGRLFQFNKSLPECVLVDLDGTVAYNNGHRSPYDWSKVGQDSPRSSIIEICRLYESIGVSLVFLTGRDGECYETSRLWVNKHVFNGSRPIESINLFSRAIKDTRKDDIVKEEMINSSVLPRWYPKLLLDDRRQVSYHLRCLGLEVLQVDFGLF